MRNFDDMRFTGQNRTNFLNRQALMDVEIFSLIIFVIFMLLIGIEHETILVLFQNCLPNTVEIGYDVHEGTGSAGSAVRYSRCSL